MVEQILQKLNKDELIHEVLTLHSEVEYWQTMAKQFQNALYGKKSEKQKYIDEVTQPLFEFEDTNPEIPNQESDSNEDDSQDYRKKSRNRLPKNYDHHPRREKIIPVPESERMCDCCNKERKFLRYETREILNYVSGYHEVIVEKREVLACCSQADTPIVTAPLPVRLLPYVTVSDSLIIWIIVSKVIDRQTLYHLEQIMSDRYHSPMSRQSMARWLIQTAAPLQKMGELIKKHLKSYDVMWVDATRFQVLKEETKKPETDSYCYCAKGGPPGQPAVLFEYSENHHQFLKPFLEGWKGYLHCDALNAYSYLNEIPDIKLVLCNVHNRRKYKVIEDTNKKKKIGVAHQILKYYSTAYRFEKAIKMQSPTADDRKKQREEKIKPIMNQIKQLVDTKLPVTSTSVRLYDALMYSSKHWAGLTTFFEDGRLEMDNNYCEQRSNILPWHAIRSCLRIQ